MNIYDRVFINFYNFYKDMFYPNLTASIQFVAFLQIAHVAIISVFLGIFEKMADNYRSQFFTINCIITFALCFFNVFFYSKKKLENLLSVYDKFSDSQKTKSRFISLAVVLITVIGFILALVYSNYLHNQKVPTQLLGCAE